MKLGTRTCCMSTLLSPSNVNCTSYSAFSWPTRLSVFRPCPPHASRHSYNTMEVLQQLLGPLVKKQLRVQKWNKCHELWLRNKSKIKEKYHIHVDPPSKKSLQKHTTPMSSQKCPEKQRLLGAPMGTQLCVQKWNRCHKPSLHRQSMKDIIVILTNRQKILQNILVCTAKKLWGWTEWPPPRRPMSSQKCTEKQENIYWE